VEASQSRRLLFGTLSLASVVVGIAGWVPLVLSAALAMGTAAHSTVALALGFAALAACAGLSLGVLALLRGRHAAIEFTAVLGVGKGASPYGAKGVGIATLNPALPVELWVGEDDAARALQLFPELRS
jgi:hypothetical protein